MSALAQELAANRRTDSGERPRPAWLPMAVAMVALLAVYAVWQITRWPGGHRTLIGDLFFYPVGLAAIGAAMAASRRCRADARLSSAWLLIGIASVAYLAGDVTQTVYEFVGNKPYPSIADGLYLSFYPLMLVGLLRFPVRHRRPADRMRLALDLAVVALAGSLVVVYVVLGPTVLEGGSNLLQTVFSIAYPVGDMVLLVGLGSVLLRQTMSTGVATLRLLAVGLSFYVVADLIYGYVTLHSGYQGGDPVDAVWMVAIAALALAASTQAPPAREAEVVDPEERARSSWLPVAAVTVGFGVLLFNQRHDRLMPDFVLVIGSVATAILVSIRQFLAQRDLLTAQGRLSHQSMHDALTGLPNRALVLDRAEHMLARGRRTHEHVAALYVDIDGFKNVNDSFGHGVGDELLRVVASRLTEVVRESDTVGRLGGDEFIVLLENFALDATPELVAERICQVLAQPTDLAIGDRRPLSITASVGIGFGQQCSADELMRDADLALYAAKNAGKNRWTVFESRMQTAAQDRLELEMDLTDALTRDEFFLLYQPTFDLANETLSGIEALIRWNHPTRGIVPPDSFIPIAEETGLIVDIGRWVLWTACERAAAWHNEGHHLGMSVNVSARQLDDDTFVSDVAAALAATGLDPGALTLEVTETALMRDAQESGRRLTALKALGVRLAIDDFGTGYSSLAYLRQFPVDVLKIDRSFISGIAASGESTALIHTLVQLGKVLGIDTLGEGIEENHQLRYLQDEHCDFGQGYLFARPLAVEDVDRLIEAAAASSSDAR